MSAHTVTLLLFSTLVIAACSPPQTDPLPPDITRTTPSIIGEITSVALPVILVEENPAEKHGSDKASVGLTDRTTVLHQGGNKVGIKELSVGQRVKVWFSGPVMESYPAQAKAGVIIIESDGR